MNKHLITLALAAITTSASAEELTGQPPPAPASQWAKALDDLGIYPSFMLQEGLFHSINYGVEPGKVELISSYQIGLDLDLGKLAGLQGGSFHFADVQNYGRINNSVGSLVGSFPLAQIPPNAPRSDVPIFTYQQQLMDNRLDVEVGRKNVVWFFMDEFSAWENFSRLSNYTWLVLPPPYATWSGRVKYEFSPGWYSQVGAWDNNTTLWGSDGWKWNTNHSNGTVYLGTVGYHRPPSADGTPLHYEITGYHIAAPESDPYSGETHHGAQGVIVSAGQLIRQLDPGPYQPTAQALYLYGAAGFNLQGWVDSGVAADAYIGLSWLNPFHRQGDIIGIKAEATRLTAAKQATLQTANLSAGGSGYTASRNTAFIQLYSQLALTRYLSFNPYLAYGFGANTAFRSSTTVKPRSGYVTGFMLTLDLGKLAGLPSPHF